MKFDRHALGLIPQLEQHVSKVMPIPAWPPDLEAKVAEGWEKFCTQHPRLNPLTVRFLYKVRTKPLDFLVMLEPQPSLISISISWAKPGQPFDDNNNVSLDLTKKSNQRRRNYYDSDLKIPDTVPEDWV